MIEPPEQLIALLDRLTLATPGQVASITARVRRLAGELPPFESLWVDALAQARILTPFQAAQINAGRGNQLAVGPYLLCRQLASPTYATCYAARRRESVRAVRLLLAKAPSADNVAAARALHKLVEQSSRLQAAQVPPIIDAGVHEGHAWTACDSIEGINAAQWMVENGRFPPDAVSHIAREMLSGLCELERHGIVHGDLAASGLIIDPSGRVFLHNLGLRAIIRPAEGFAFGDLAPEAYDYLAPERVTEGAPASLATDIYAAGSLWWHLLTGRPPFAGGNSLHKLRAVQMARPRDLKELAPGASPQLVKVIVRCMERDPQLRPQSFDELAKSLGGPARPGQLVLARCLFPHRHPRVYLSKRPRKRRRSGGRRTLSAVVGVCILVLVGGFCRPWTSPPEGDVAASSPDKKQNHAPALGSLEAANKVTPASYSSPEPAEDKGSSDSQTIAKPMRPRQSVPPLLLDAGETVELSSIDLRPGQMVTGRDGERARVRVPASGLVVKCEDITFENIDFIWDASEQSGEKRPALIVVRADKCEFRGCSMKGGASGLARPVAVAWLGRPALERSPPVLHSGELVWTDCAIRGVAAGIECRLRGALSVQFRNTLHLESGPLVRLVRCPRVDEALLLSLSHVTLREGGPVLECGYDRLSERPGQIIISASDSAFVLPKLTALVEFHGTDHPGPLLSPMEWTGQGSLLNPEAGLCAWRDGEGRAEPLPEDSLTASGLARSPIRFAAQPAGGPQASRIVKWQGPILSAEPPGISPEVLFLP